uniref:Peptidase S1 domain-containing protein n=1 Tax=Oryza punctata TaxID=4537 RepID=A0A0E0KMC5_ORYPU
MADLPSQKVDDSLLQGWPPHRVNSTIWGHASYTDRTYDVLTSSNFKGYIMKLTEFPEFDCADGFSGGPIINGDSQCIVVFHAVMKDAKSGYAICLEDIRAFLATALENLMRMRTRMAEMMMSRRPRHNNNLYILTTTHVVDTMYKEGVHQVSARDFNTAFLFGVICTHHEACLKEINLGPDVSQLLRSHCDAQVVPVDTQRDLPLLEPTRPLCLKMRVKCLSHALRIIL